MLAQILLAQIFAAFHRPKLPFQKSELLEREAD
jgi:hypothetical protein